MISMLTVMLLSSASAMDAQATRVSYSNCLVDFTITHLEQKTAVSAFRKAAKETCVSERDAMAAAMKKDEIEFGSSAKEAEEYANEEVGGVLFAFTEGYSGYLNTNSQPVKE